MIHVTIGNPNLNVAKTQMGEGVIIPASLELGGWLFNLIDITN